MTRRRMNGVENFYRGNGSDDNTPESRFSIEKNRTWYIVGLFVFVLVFINVFSWSMFRSVYRPFDAMEQRSAEKYPAIMEKPSQEEVQLAMKSQDTDADGLNDYDETFLYSTSVYLTDTDSDGMSDKEEIDKGENPTCPKNTNCGMTSSEDNQVSSAENKTFNEFAAETLRQTLLGMGVNKDQLAVFSDEELMEIYQEAISSQQEQVAGIPQESGLTPDSLKYFEDLEPNEIRQLLVKAGLDEDLINPVPDDELMKIYLETLNDNQVDGQ